MYGTALVVAIVHALIRRDDTQNLANEMSVERAGIGVKVDIRDC